MYSEDSNFNLLIEQTLLRAGLKTPAGNGCKLNLPLCVCSVISIILSLVFLSFLNG